MHTYTHAHARVRTHTHTHTHARTLKKILLTCCQLSYLQAKNQLHPACFSGNIGKICELLILGTLDMPGCTNPKWQYQLVNDFDVYLHAKHLSFIFFLRYYIIRNPATWLADSILAHNSRTRILADMELWWNINNISFHFRLFPRKPNDKIFQKIKKTLFWGHFGLFWPHLGRNEFPRRKWLSVFRYSSYLPSRHKLEKTIQPFLRKTPKWRTDRQKMVIL